MAEIQSAYNSCQTGSFSPIRKCSFAVVVKQSQLIGQSHRRHHDVKVAITIKDHGLGIPEKDQDRVFEKFFRARNVKQMDTDGSGLGLYISRKIMENLGGKITFKSEEGKGTTVVVTLTLK